MPCPKCKSPVVRVAEPGFASNDMLCMKCGHSYRRVSPVIKSAGAHTAAFALPTLLMALLHGDDHGDLG